MASRAERHWARKKEEAQKITHYTSRGKAFARIAWDGDEPCADCGVNTNQFHVYPLCNQEQCPRCEGKALSCGCGLTPLEVVTD